MRKVDKNKVVRERERERERKRERKKERRRCHWQGEINCYHSSNSEEGKEEKKFSMRSLMDQQRRRGVASKEKDSGITRTREEEKKSRRDPLFSFLLSLKCEMHIASASKSKSVCLSQYFRSLTLSLSLHG